MRIIPFTDAINVTAIALRLAPIDVGFDLRAEGVTVALDADTDRVSYEHAGRVLVVEGTRTEIAKTLCAAGYTVVER